MTLSNNNSWSTRKIRRSDRPLVEWLCLGTVGDPEITVGVLKDGSWVVNTADGLADLEDARALTMAFPVLNSSTCNIHERLAEFQENSEIANWKEFPLNRLVVHAISKGGYWAEQSLPWLSEIELNDCARKAAIDGLIMIENNKEFSQALRHKARRYRQQIAR